MISTCPSCDKKLKTPEGDEGRTIRCPGCKTELVVTADGLSLPEEDEAPRRSRREEDEAPRRSRRDEEEEGRPRRPRHRDEDEDDDRPRRSRRRDDDDDDSPRRRSRKGKSGGMPLWVWLSIGGGVLTLILVVVLLIVFLGGGSDKIKVGMTEAEVNSALGSPFIKVGDRVVYSDPPMTQQYAAKNMREGMKIKTFYFVIFEGGKVKKYKKEKPTSSSMMDEDKDPWNF